MAFFCRKTPSTFAALRPAKGPAEGNPSVCCGGQLPLHRGGEGNPLSLLQQPAPSLQGASTLSLLKPTQGARVTSVCYATSSPYRGGEGNLSLLRTGGPAPPFFAPTQLFELFRCYGRLIFRKEYTVLFSTKTLDLQPLCGLRSRGATPQSAAATILLEKGS